MFSTCAELSFPPKNSESNFFQDPLLANFDPRKKYNLDHVTFYTLRMKMKCSKEILVISVK